jgi:EAL domain-containing protein (putative c-di-GMP-specific phosphodiesterase class I)
MRFLEDDNDGERGGDILESIVRMTKWLGMSVIVEGVEEKAQADFLTSIGCSNIQGYYYSKPLPVDEYEAYCSNLNKDKCLVSINAVDCNVIRHMLQK